MDNKLWLKQNEQSY